MCESPHEGSCAAEFDESDPEPPENPAALAPSSRPRRRRCLAGCGAPRIRASVDRLRAASAFAAPPAPLQIPAAVSAAAGLEARAARSDEVRQAAMRFPIGPRARAYRRRLHHGLSAAEWNDWRWQAAHTLRTHEALARAIRLHPDEAEALRGAGDADRPGLPVAVTPYYAAQIEAGDPDHALRRVVIPRPQEWILSPGEAADPLGEEHQEVVAGLVHRYPDRALFMVTDVCSSYCRYCTRSRMVGGDGEVLGCQSTRGRWEKALAYLEQTPAVRDVIVSGGDPLTLPDEALAWLLGRLRAIPHIEIIRIGTRMPAVLPQRVTPGLVKTLRRFHPLWMSLHFSHPDELTPESAEACARLADAGIPLGSQTVLLAGVNDEAEVMTKLMRGLLRMRVRPYYLYQCDPILGSAHFRAPVEKGLEMIRALRGHTSGYAVPQYVIDAPGGGGKVPLLPDYVEGRDAEGWTLFNYEGRRYRYPETIQPL